MILKNGSVLPSGLLSLDTYSNIGGFNKTYKNFALRAGIVVASHDIGSKRNLSKLIPEYDVLVIEQDSNRGITPITYRNCINANGFGGVADYFEYKLRAQKTKKNKKTNGMDFNGQDGSIVLLLCLDGVSEKAIIIGALQHPDRKTKLKGKDHVLSGEFNGVSIDVADDGSASLTFKGATDNEGKPKDKEQGNTTVSIEKDGSLQFKNKGVTHRMEKAGNILIQNEGSTTLESKKELIIKTQDKINIEGKDTSIKLQKLVLEAQGSAALKGKGFEIDGDSKIDLKGKMINIKGDSGIKIESSQITLDGMVMLGGSGGQPLLTIAAQFQGVGNQGAPVMSMAISGFTTKVMGT